MIYWDFEHLKTTTYRHLVLERVSKKTGKEYKVAECDTIITFDIEASSGWKQPNGEVIGWDPVLAKFHPEYYNLADFKEQRAYGRPLPYALMYVWQCCVEDVKGINTYLGRTWEEFYKFMDILTKTVASTGASICKKAKARSKHEKPMNIHIYIHNLSYEFTFLRNLFDVNFSKVADRMPVFARERQCPLKASFMMNEVNVNLHDTLCLVNKSLATWCKDEELEVQKLIEPKDYYLPVRTPATELDTEEIQYSVNDVESMYYGVRKFREIYGHLALIPMTQTGRVRPTLRSGVARRNSEWVSQCQTVNTETDLELFSHICDTFVGGWTHASVFKTAKLYGVHTDGRPVYCFDFRSSYPASMTQFTFPTGTYKPITKAEKDAIDATNPVNRNKRYFFKAKIKNVISNTQNTFWSLSHIHEIGDFIVDNGKIAMADWVVITLSDLDWAIFSKAYSFDEDIEFEYIYAADAEYLPPQLIKIILDYYGAKTSLKNVEGAESRYAEAKIFINCIYGDFVLKTITDACIFVGADITPEHIEDLLSHGLLTEDDIVRNTTGEINIDLTSRNIRAGWMTHKSNENDFYSTMQDLAANPELYTTYQVGCVVTAASRFNLWTAILAMDSRVIYGDTDSIKGTFTDEDLKWIEGYNKEVKRRYTDVVEYYKVKAPKINIKVSDYEPKTPKGEPKELGYFDEDPPCLLFKTMGAKRYVDIVENKGRYEIHATIAGIAKIDAETKFAKLSGVPYHIDKKTVVLDTTDLNDLIKVMDTVQDGVTWAPEETHKLTAYYLDDMTPAVWVDRNGDKYTSTILDRFGVCLQPASFCMGFGAEYANLVRIIRDEPGVDSWGKISSFLKK